MSREVAEVYTLAVEHGFPPVVAVQDAFQVSRATATRWIAKARSEGTLTAPNQHGVFPRTRRVQAVADALGVTADALRAAIIEYADGDLRVR